MKRNLWVVLTGLWVNLVLFVAAQAQPLPAHDLQLESLPKVWDEALPLGNGMLGALVWEKEGTLRFSLDRADLWDLRPMKGLHRSEFSYDWVRMQVDKGDYGPVQEYFDMPYEREPAPTKIPAGALQFSFSVPAKVVSARLTLSEALCRVIWDNGMSLTSFVHATEPVGWFRFENIQGDLVPELLPPPYQGTVQKSSEVNSVTGDDLVRLGYPTGSFRSTDHELTYTQEGWGGFSYRISVRWRKTGDHTMEGVWSISSQYPDAPRQTDAPISTAKALDNSFANAFSTHRAWWEGFWSRSAIRIPDPVLEKQWYLEKYKFGSVARMDTPPISLQAVWTADNGRIPPWKGDFHHDLNTQLSYWPAYSGNHTDLALGYLNHLDQNKNNYRRYTRLYFGVDGLNVPGVTTLDGTEMGGWIQYSLSPTVSSWLAHHYYLQWRYTMDREFLSQRAYPWFREVCLFLEKLTKKDEKGLRQLPLSSSPEINDNRITAWFRKNTNYDLALMRFVFQAAAELAEELKRSDEARQWKAVLREFGDFALTDQQELMIAPDLPYQTSHRHLSHLMAIHPLSLIRWEDGEKAQAIIRNSLAQLEAVGPDWWCGYSYSWMGSLQARAKNGESAAKYLGIFAKAFCLPNSFHVNGDQTKSGYSKFTYRPFTLEGNMAFAAGLQEMLLQSYAGFIEVMPAIPDDWKDVSFRQLRAEGAFLVDADRKGGIIREIRIKAEVPGDLWLKMPTLKWKVVSAKGMETGAVKEGKLLLKGKVKDGEIVLQFDA